jgi:hypothetical protein
MELREEGAIIDPRPMLGAFAGDLSFPVYRVAARGAWSLRVIQMVAARGYWGEVFPIGGTVLLAGPSDEGSQSWMSLLPSEIESQAIGLQAARGYTVVLGLGMGWLAANVALRPEVSRLTVVERDADVIALIDATELLHHLPAEAREKIEIVHADARDWRPDQPVDTLQADIWRKFVEDGKLDDVRHIQDNIGAAALYFWGQEMEIWRLACRRNGGTPKLDWPMLREIVAEDIRLPLIVPDWPDYPQKIAAGAPWWTPKDDPGWWR